MADDGYVARESGVVPAPAVEPRQPKSVRPCASPWGAAAGVIASVVSGLLPGGAPRATTKPAARSAVRTIVEAGYVNSSKAEGKRFRVRRSLSSAFVPDQGAHVEAFSEQGAEWGVEGTGSVALALALPEPRH